MLSGHAIPSLEWTYTQSIENSLMNASWVREGQTPTPLGEQIEEPVIYQVSNGCKANLSLVEDFDFLFIIYYPHLMLFFQRYVAGKDEITRQIFREVAKEDHGKSFSCNMTGKNQYLIWPYSISR